MVVGMGVPSSKVAEIEDATPPPPVMRLRTFWKAIVLACVYVGYTRCGE